MQNFSYGNDIFDCTRLRFSSTQLRTCKVGEMVNFVVTDFLSVKQFWAHIGGLVQDCGNSSALAMELLQSCTKPSTLLKVD